MIYLFTGQPGSGKTSIGGLLASSMKNVIHIDGDDLRLIFDNNDYSESGRRINIERAHDIAYFLSKKNINVIITMVSPFRDLRDRLRLKLTNIDFIEIYVHTSDLRGKENFFVKNYEKPLDNFIDLDTTNKTVEESFEILKKSLKNNDFNQ